MKKYYYKKSKKINLRSFGKIAGLFLSLTGIVSLFYVISPLISWQVYFAPVFAESSYQAPIPKTVVITKSTITTLFENATTGVDYTNAQNWFPRMVSKNAQSPKVSSYFLLVPKLGIKDALVSTVDYNLADHLVNYSGTAIPADNGNSVVIGHSTLPQLFDPKNYKTIFANAYKLVVGDEFLATVQNVEYKYKIFSITVVDPDDTSAFSQSYDNSYLTVITCTPPGTTWKRLIIRSALQKING